MNLRRVALRAAIVLVAIGVLGAGFVYWYDSVGQKADPNFDTAVKSPAYAAGAGPLVAFDVAHRNWHTPDGRYKPFADLLRHDGYRVAENKAAFAAESLAPYHVLIVANAMGPDGHEGHPAFTEAEDAALAAWVRDGGSLLLIADHVPFGSAAEDLAKRFGVTMYLAFARDDAHHDGWDNERLVFSRQNGLLTSGAIADGRNAAKRVNSVTTFTGQSLSVPRGAVPFLRMDDASYDWESSSVRNSARGHAQGINMTFGKGRVVMLGEAGLLSAQVDPLGFKMGMNAAGNDDKQLALNIMHWLSGASN